MDYFLNLLQNKKHTIWFFLSVSILIALLFNTILGVSIFSSVIMFLVYILFLIIAFEIWYRTILILPRNRKWRIWIVVSLVSENNIQEKKIKRDFIEALQKDVKTANEHYLPIDIIFLKQHQAENLLKTGNPDKIQETVKAHFYIVWEVIERKIDSKDTYIIENNYVLYWVDTSDIVKDRIRKIMQALCVKIEIGKDNEYKWFAITSQLMAFNVKYIIGIGALVFWDIGFSYSIHSTILKSEYRKILRHPNSDFILRELKKIVYEESEILCDFEFSKDNFIWSKIYIDKMFELWIWNYWWFLRRAIFEFKKGSIEIANKTINSAKQNSAWSLQEWRFSKAFLYIWEWKYIKFNSEKKRLYNKCSGIDYWEDFLNSIVIFANKEYILNPNKHQLQFWSWYITYKIKWNIPESYKYFENFISKIEENHPLFDEAFKYYNEIKNRIWT